MKLGRLITHCGTSVASIAPWRAQDGTHGAILSCTSGEASASVSLDTAELRATAASLLDLADEIDGYNETPQEVAP